jgi:predicted phosphate transport protein (TIGR00153 family)
VPMRFILPREERFYDMFEEQAKIVADAGALLYDLFDKYERVEEKTRAIKEAEVRADRVTHTIIDKLNMSFITPFDRGDIHRLACGIDEVLDYLEVAAHKTYLYNIQEVTPESRHLSEIIHKGCEEMLEAVRSLRNFNEAHKRLININALEEEADRVVRYALAGLFESNGDAITILKYKEIYEQLEATTDRQEDVANIIDGIIVKNR